MQTLKSLAAIAALLLITVASTRAQQGGFGRGSQSGFSGGGMSSGMSSGMGSGFGNNGFGSSGFGGGMNSGFGSSSFGGGFGSSGFGSGEFGGGFGTSSLGGTGGFGQSSLGAGAQGNQGNRGFIGRDSADMTAVFDQLGRNSNEFFQQMNRSMNRAGRDRRSSSQEENVALPVRVQLHVAFDHPRSQPAAVATAVRGRLDKLLLHRNIIAPDVEIVGDTVVLRGVAASESQRLVIEKLVSLEPGVVAVENRMTVAEEPSPSPPVPPHADN